MCAVPGRFRRSGPLALALLLLLGPAEGAVRGEVASREAIAYPAWLGPTKGRVVEVHRLHSPIGTARTRVLLWERGRYAESDHPRMLGLRVVQRAPRDGWRLVYRINHWPLAEVVRAGKPGRVRRALMRPEAYGMTVDVGDVNGDARDDLLFTAFGTGTGGCSFSYVLENNPTGVRRLRVDDACNTRSVITRAGLLRIREARFGDHCEAAHGCWSRTRWLAWTVNDWRQKRLVVPS